MHTDVFPPRPPRPKEGFYTSTLAAARGWPLRTFLPSGYEPNYAYPLLVFLHGHGSSEEHVLRLAPQLSRRNYVCIGLRGPHRVTPRSPDAGAYSWGLEAGDDAAVEEYVFRAVEQTRRNYHVHSERIYLAGFGEGATLAYRLGLLFPARFAGIISLNGCLPRLDRPLLRLPDVRHLRVLIGHGLANAVVPLAWARDDQRLLYTAGLDVTMHTYLSTHRVHPQMLDDVNRWVMKHINDEYLSVA